MKALNDLWLREVSDDEVCLAIRSVPTHYSLAFRLPEHSKIEEILNPATDAAGRTGAWITAKFAHKVFFVCHLQQGNAATVTFTVKEAQDLSGTSAQTFATNVPIWANEDTSTATGTDTLVKQTDGTSYTTGAATKNKIVVFEVDPSFLNNAGPATPWKTLTIATGASNAANITQCIAYVIFQRYSQATPPSMNTTA
jgi:hypothetical protein